MSARHRCTVLQYVGYDVDRGGILTVLRTLAETQEFACVLGVNRGFLQTRRPPLETRELPRTAGETIAPGPLLRALGVARRVRAWLRADGTRIFHGHSRAGLLTGLWLAGFGETRTAVSVHCYGRQRWFYRWAKARLGRRLCWLSPAMKKYYGAGPATWDDCLPDCIAPARLVRRRREPGAVLTFGLVGSFVPAKRWDLAVTALRQLPRAVRTQVRFVHAGDADGTRKSTAYAAGLKARAAAQGVADRIEWRGWVEAMEGFWGEIDCLLVASPVEAFSVVALEALAAGVPVLASDRSGASDLVTEARGGWLFAGDSPAELAAQLTVLVQGRQLREWNPYPSALQRFLAPAVARQYGEYYQTLLGAE
ncbi:MAG TPA: glycosyltransferase family 4 protein [Opitutaceae bacterium]|nr:glycosyltransferase family 4 protein [Opitutaceae bacterium]